MESSRLATPGDLARVTELWADAVAELEPQRGGSLLAGTVLADSGEAAPVPNTWLRAALSDPDRTLVVGLFDGGVFGFALAHLDRRRRPPLATIDLLHVERAAREVGVGEAVLQSVVAWADEQGAGGVDAPALPGNRAAKGFFETQGFTTRLLTMHRSLRS